MGDKNLLQNSEDFGSFTVSFYDKKDNLSGNLSRIPIDSGTKMQLSNLIQQLPLTVVNANSTGLYKVSFPEGLPHTLTKLRQRGYGSMLKDSKTGRFVGSASFEEFSLHTSMLSTFTAMSVITGQYFLSEINSSLKIINQKLDKILEFLYGEKKAELIAEINFAKYAYQNYATIMKNESQRIATIASIQSSRKVAMKDIEFYMNDLDSSVNTDAKLGNTMDEVVTKSFQIYESIDLSLQLYAVSTLLEIYYSQTLESSYIDFLSDELKSYIEKCDKRELADLSILKRRLDDFKTIAPMKGKLDKQSLLPRIDEQIEMLHSSGNSDKYKEIQSAIVKMQQPSEYIINTDGDLFQLSETA